MSAIACERERWGAIEKRLVAIKTREIPGFYHYWLNDACKSALGR